MNPSLLHDAWTIASGSPALALALLFAAIGALLLIDRRPTVRIDQEHAEELRKASVDAAFVAGLPKYQSAGPKGFRPGFPRDHAATVTRRPQ